MGFFLGLFNIKLLLCPFLSKDLFFSGGPF